MGNNNSNSVISQCLDWVKIPECVSAFLDYHKQKLTCSATIRLFIEAQLSKRQDPECIAENLRACPELKALTGLTSIDASSLSRQLEKLPTWLLQYLFQEVTHQLSDFHRESQGCPPKNVTKLSIVDSTSISLPDFHGKWAYCSKEKNSVKLHLRLLTEKPDLAIPSKVVLTSGAVADTEIAVQLVTERGTTYVMDRGYINHAHFKQWLEAGILFVVRLKMQSKTEILETRSLPDGDPQLLLDADVLMRVPNHPNQTMILRLVEFLDDKGRKYRLITSRWDLSAREIADIYRDRWGIELFFKSMKQNLGLTKLFSSKQQAVWNQIYVTLIANALTTLVKLKTKTKHGMSKLLKLMRQYLFESWGTLLAVLFRKPTKKSKGRKKKAKRGRPRIHPAKPTSQRIVVPNDFNQ